MKIEFKNDEILNYYTCNYKGKQIYSEVVLKGYREILIIVEEAGHFGELRKFKSLNIEPYKDHWSARINKQWRLEFNYVKPDTFIVLKISKHYEK